MHRRPAALLLAAVAAAVLAFPAAAPAAPKYKVSVGIGDQNASMFSSPAYQALKLRKTRYFIPWNAASNPNQLALADAFVQAANARRVKVLMHISTDRFLYTKQEQNRAKPPSVKAYRKAVGALIKRYKPMGVREWGAWNEANHKTQPTWKSPKRAAQYFLAMRSACGKGCTIVALDALDQTSKNKKLDVRTYIRGFYKALGSKRRFAKVVGIHNYSDTNRADRKGRGTSTIIREVKRHNRSAKFWMTETGGLVLLGDGRSFPCNERRAATATKRMFSLAAKHRRDVQRLYAYNWQGTDCTTRFDAGLVRADGSVRPAYAVFKSKLRSFRR